MHQYLGSQSNLNLKKTQITFSQGRTYIYTCMYLTTRIALYVLLYVLCVYVVRDNWTVMGYSPMWTHSKCTWHKTEKVIYSRTFIHRSPVYFPHKGQWRGAFMFSLICGWINRWVNNREAGDLRRYRAHYDVIVRRCLFSVLIYFYLKLWTVSSWW